MFEQALMYWQPSPKNPSEQEQLTELLFVAISVQIPPFRQGEVAVVLQFLTAQLSAVGFGVTVRVLEAMV